MTNANPKAEDFNFNPESACQCDHDLALGCPANPGRVYGNDGTVGLCESGEDSPWSPDGPRTESPEYIAARDLATSTGQITPAQFDHEVALAVKIEADPRVSGGSAEDYVIQEAQGIAQWFRREYPAKA
jgi:hypothetical protein